MVNPYGYMLLFLTGPLSFDDNDDVDFVHNCEFVVGPKSIQLLMVLAEDSMLGACGPCSTPVELFTKGDLLLSLFHPEYENQSTSCALELFQTRSISGSISCYGRHATTVEMITMKKIFGHFRHA